jgi:surface carbohydrate biosynthesis protein
MNESRLLFLPIEIVERELESKLLVAAEAISRGYSAVLGRYSMMPEIAKKAGFGFYIHKAHTDYRAGKLFIPLEEAGLQCGALDEEGLVFPSFASYAKQRVGTGISFAHLDTIMTWGDEQRSYLAKSFPEYSSKMVSVGNPRIDLLKHPYRGGFEEKISAIRREHGEFILINTNFGPGNYTTSHKLGFAEHMKFYGYDKTPEEVAYTERRIAYYASLFSHYVEMIKRLASAVPGTTVIVRPHPAENHDHWRDELKTVPNVKVIFEGAVNPWIAAAKCMIHTGCTTGIEAFFLGTPVARFNPHPDNTIEADLPNSLSAGYANIDGLIGAIKAMLEGKADAADDLARRKHLAEWIANTDGKYSFELMMDAIDAAYRGNNTGSRNFWRAVRQTPWKRLRSTGRYCLTTAKAVAASIASRDTATAKSLARPIGMDRRRMARRIRRLIALKGTVREVDFSVHYVTRDIIALVPKR